MYPYYLNFILPRMLFKFTIFILLFLLCGCNRPVIDEYKAEWCHAFGSRAEDKGAQLAIGGDGNIYFSGTYRNSVNFGTQGNPINHSVEYGSDPEVFIMKASANGEINWVRTWDKTSDRIHNGIFSEVSCSVDSDGSVYVTGWFYGITDLDPSLENRFQVTGNPNGNAFLIKFDANGDFIWARTWESCHATDIGIDQDQNIYVTGLYVTDRPTDFDPGPGISERLWMHEGEPDFFLSKFDRNGEFKWVRIWSGADPSTAYKPCLTIDYVGNIIISGPFNYTEVLNPDLGIQIQPFEGGHNDVLLIKFDPSGEYKWAYAWGSADDDFGKAVVTDHEGNVYLAGTYSGLTDFDPGPGINELGLVAGDEDVFITKFEVDGKYKWTRTWGDMYLDNIEGISIDSNNQIYVLGNSLRISNFRFGPDDDISGQSNQGYDDIKNSYITVLNSTGDVIKIINWDGLGKGIVIDNADNIYLGGYFWSSTDFHGLLDAEIQPKGHTDIFLMKLPPLFMNDGE